MVFFFTIIKVITSSPAFVVFIHPILSGYAGFIRFLIAFTVSKNK